jgi:polyisoprenoid-binding protein YceI
MNRFIAVAAAGLTLAAAPVPEEWNVDPSHTAVTFSVKHFFTPGEGQFDDFEISVLYDEENPANSTVEARIAVASVNTNNDRRDEHLRSEDFFEAEAHPYITFQSTSVRPVSDGKFVATGDLTIKGVTQQVELPVEVLGIQEIPPQMQGMLDGSKRVASFQAGTTVDRRDFGVGVGDWAATMVVGKDVAISIAVEANQK